MVVTPGGIIKFVKLLQLLKVPYSISVIAHWILTSVNALQSAKTKDPIKFTLEGIVILVKFLQPEKALFPIEVK